MELFPIGKTVFQTKVYTKLPFTTKKQVKNGLEQEIIIYPNIQSIKGHFETLNKFINVQKCRDALEKLARTKTVKWVPGHKCVDGNERGKSLIT